MGSVAVKLGTAPGTIHLGPTLGDVDSVQEIAFLVMLPLDQILIGICPSGRRRTSRKNEVRSEKILNGSHSLGPFHGQQAVECGRIDSLSPINSNLLEGAQEIGLKVDTLFATIRAGDMVNNALFELHGQKFRKRDELEDR